MAFYYKITPGTIINDHRSRVSLFYMGMVVDMVFAVAEVAVTAAAIAELQTGIRYIGAAANRAAVTEIGCGFLF